MPKTSYSDWSTTAASNTDINSINIDEGCAMAGLNNAIREMMAQLKTAGFVSASGTLADPNADNIVFWDDSAGGFAYLTIGSGLAISGTTLRKYEAIVIAVSDETTAITTGTAKVTFRMPFAMTLTEVRASVNTVSSSGLPTFDINEAGVSILSTTLTIDANEKTSTTAATAAVISDTTLADDAEMTIDIDTAGTGAKGAKVTLIGYRT